MKEKGQGQLRKAIRTEGDDTTKEEQNRRGVLTLKDRCV